MTLRGNEIKQLIVSLHDLLFLIVTLISVLMVFHRSYCKPVFKYFIWSNSGRISLLTIKTIFS